MALCEESVLRVNNDGMSPWGGVCECGATPNEHSWLGRYLELVAYLDRLASITLGKRPTKVIHNGPATIVMWADGTKTVTKCSDKDKYDEVMGLMLCTLRKALGNSTVGDKWEGVAKRVSKSARDPKGLRMLAEALRLAADAMELED